MSTLWLVATPIGNLGDLQPRAVEILDRVALVCCEDTRRTGLLLQHAGIRAERLAVCNEHTEYARIDDMLDVLGSGRDVAVVSDAGTPGVSDPGERLVAAALDAGHDVSAVPGPSAAVMAVTVSGLPTDRFVFEGFLPRKGRDRTERLAEIATERRTVVIYESPQRVVKSIADLAAACGADRRVSVSRELTKLYEETVRGTLATVDLGEPRGEYVIVLDGAPVDDAEATDDEVRSSLAALLADGATARDAAAEVSDTTGRRKRDVYEIANALRNDTAGRSDTAGRNDTVGLA
jgi:16S rRNA (cytidine1402-2'-O)-methyltransferase